MSNTQRTPGGIHNPAPKSWVIKIQTDPYVLFHPSHTKGGNLHPSITSLSPLERHCNSTLRAVKTFRRVHTQNIHFLFCFSTTFPVLKRGAFQHVQHCFLQSKEKITRKKQFRLSTYRISQCYLASLFVLYICNQN